VVTGKKTTYIVKGVLSSLLFLGIFLAVLEVCARIDDLFRYGAALWSPYSADQLTALDEAGIKYNVPGARFEKWQNNARGFRGVDVPLEKPHPDTVRVVCLGSSETYGLFESPGEEWPAQLQRLLPLPSWQIINAGVVGIDLRGYRAYLVKHVLPLNPDVVIIVTHPNRYATKYVRDHEFKASAQALPRSPGKRSGCDPPFDLSKQIRFLPRFKQSLKAGMHKSFPAILQKYQERDMGRQVREIEQTRLKGRKALDFMPERCQEDFRRDLQDVVALLKDKGIRVMLTSYPSLLDRSTLDSYREIFMDARRFSVEYSLAGLIDTRERLNAASAALAVSEGAMYADLCARVPHDSKYFGDGAHYTDQGARVVAETVADTLTVNITKVRAGGKTP
jgi:lysophospholipase L1-like esterase